VEIHHVGYINPELRARKLQRDFRLLKMEYAENPDDPFVLFNLAAPHAEFKNHAEALTLMRRSLRLSDPQDSILRKLYAMMANCHRKMGQNSEAVQVCLANRKLYPDDAEMLHIEAIARDDSGDAAGAECCYRRLLDGRENGHYFASVADGLRGHISRHNLAVLLFKQKR